MKTFGILENCSLRRGGRERGLDSISLFIVCWLFCLFSGKIVLRKSFCFDAMVLSFLFLQSSASEWRVVFYIGGLIYIIGAIFYCVFASGKKQSWAAGYSELAETDEEDKADS